MTTTMKCPICRDNLVPAGAGAMWCPRRHGLAVTRAILGEAKLFSLGPHLLRIDASVPPGEPGNARGLHCPSCHEVMVEVDFRGSGTMIDVCLSCPARWLDAGELTRIADFVEWTGSLGPHHFEALGNIEPQPKT